MEIIKNALNSPSILELNPKDYPGGIAIWGALPAVFNSSRFPDEQNGVHVHARMEVGGSKQIDQTFDIVRVQSQNMNGESHTFDINGEDAANYNISTILGKKLKYLRCPQCTKVHSDKHYLAVSYHKEHICEHCDFVFHDSEPSISNAVMLLKETCGDFLQKREIIDPVNRKLNEKQKTFRGGIQIWGSNPAVLWTSPKLEEGGIHFHGFQEASIPEIDDTFGTLVIDDILFDPEMMRYLMAQKALKHLEGKILSVKCQNCDNLHFDRLELAIEPHLEHKCEFCYSKILPMDNKIGVSNPLIEIIRSL